MNCLVCKHWKGTGYTQTVNKGLAEEKEIENGICRRYPVWIDHTSSATCGEFSIRANHFELTRKELLG